MPLAQQAKLLRVLQTGELSAVGLVARRAGSTCACSAATNVDLREEVARGPLPRGPALPAQHRGDPHAAAARAARGHPRARARISSGARAALRKRARRASTPEALEALLAHPWPGNVRELEHAVERALLMARATEVTRGATLRSRRPRPAAPVRLEEMTLEEVERYLIRTRPGAARGQRERRGAKALGLSRSALYRRLERHGL